MCARVGCILRHTAIRDAAAKGKIERFFRRVRDQFLIRNLDLAHGTFTSGATELIIRSADGVLRRCRNLCLSAMLETVRAATGRTIDIDVVNRVLLQPHWQNQVDLADFKARGSYFLNVWSLI